MNDVIFDKKEQLEKVQAALLPGEKVEAVFDMKGGGTGFLGVTSHRLIFYDKAFLRRMKAVVSIPYSRIHSLAAEDESGLLTGRGFFPAASSSSIPATASTSSSSAAPTLARVVAFVDDGVKPEALPIFNQSGALVDALTPLAHLQSAFPPPPLAHAQSAVFGDFAQLVGYDLGQSTAAPGETVSLRLNAALPLGAV